MKTLAIVALSISLLTGCLRPHTKIEIPAQVFNASAPIEAAPATYYSERDMAIRVVTAPDGTQTVEIIGAASPVLDSKGAAIAGIINASGQFVPVPVP